MSVTALLGTVIVIIPPAPTAGAVLGTDVGAPLGLVLEAADIGMIAAVALAEGDVLVDGDMLVPEETAEEEGTTTTVVP